MYEKVFVLQISSKSVSVFIEKAFVFKATWCEMYEKVFVLQDPEKIGQISLKKQKIETKWVERYVKVLVLQVSSQKSVSFHWQKHGFESKMVISMVAGEEPTYRWRVGEDVERCVGVCVGGVCGGGGGGGGFSVLLTNLRVWSGQLQQEKWALTSSRTECEKMLQNEAKTEPHSVIRRACWGAPDFQVRTAPGVDLRMRAHLHVEKCEIRSWACVENTSEGKRNTALESRTGIDITIRDHLHIGNVWHTSGNTSHLKSRKNCVKSTTPP